jgi:ATP-dependent exoDNAse (exonuclease V) alpha subunit
VLVLAPTGKAVDVAVREGTGDIGHTIAAALRLMRQNQLTLSPATLVIVDEAAMVGTGDLHQILTATTEAGANTVLMGNAHQLAPVRARGGMRAQLCADLPWTQRLSEVWRMRDLDERAASLAMRDGAPAPVRRAIAWYRSNDRLRCGDPIAMASDAVAAYRADTMASKDALLICDTTEVADALNRRIQRQNLSATAPTVTGARGHRVGVRDIVLSRRNDPDIALTQPRDNDMRPDSIRNGNRWRVAAVDTESNRLAAERLGDGARVVFDGTYLREHVTLGYAVTVHSAQGTTADTTHAVLGESATRTMFYVSGPLNRSTPRPQSRRCTSRTMALPRRPRPNKRRSTRLP